MRNREGVTSQFQKTRKSDGNEKRNGSAKLHTESHRDMMADLLGGYWSLTVRTERGVAGCEVREGKRVNESGGVVAALTHRQSAMAGPIVLRQ